MPLTSIPSIRFGAGFLARTFARFVKDLVDVAKDIADKKAPQVQPMVDVLCTCRFDDPYLIEHTLLR